MEIDYSLVRFYAKRNCKQCLGRGVVEHQPSFSSGGFAETRKSICKCTYKSMKKAEENKRREELDAPKKTKKRRVSDLF